MVPGTIRYRESQPVPGTIRYRESQLVPGTNCDSGVKLSGVVGVICI